MPTEMLTRDEHRVLKEPPRAARPTRPDELRDGGAALCGARAPVEAERRRLGRVDDPDHDALGGPRVGRERRVRALRPRGRPRPVEPHALGARDRHPDAHRRDHGPGRLLRAADRRSRGAPHAAAEVPRRRVAVRHGRADAALGADRVAGQRRLRAVEQQQPARRLGSVDPGRRRYRGRSPSSACSPCGHSATCERPTDAR